MDRQKLFNWSLKAFLFLSPIFLFRNYSAVAARSMFFVLGSFALFAIALGLEPKRKFSDKWVSLLLILAFIRMFFDNDSSSGEWFNFWMSCAGFIYVFCGVLLFYLVYTYADQVKNYLKPILCVCIFNILLATAQIFNYDFLWANTPGICGFMEMPAQLGQYSAMSLPILFFIHPALAILPLFTLFASKAISPIVALFLGIVILSFQLKKKNVIIVLLVLLFGLGVIFSNYLSIKWYTRPIMWKRTMVSALKKPYLGWGYRSFNRVVIDDTLADSLGTTTPAKAYNDYLHTAQELGFPILLAIGAFFINLFKKFLAIKKSRLIYCLFASVIIVLINMLGQPFIRHASVAGTFVILLAFLCIEIESKVENGKN